MIQDLLKAAERVFNNRETPEEREEQIRREERELAERIGKEDREHRVRENRKNQRELAQILFVGIKAGRELREPRDPWTRENKIRQGQRWLTQAMKETILQIPEPKTPCQMREFLGTVGYCRLWIMGFAEKARPLYEGSKETPNWTWAELMKQAFQTLSRAVLEAPALALPDPNKPFQLFVGEKQGIGKGVLTQQWGPWKQPVAYLSKRLDPVAAGWPPCLRIIAATAALVRDADKLTYGQQLLVYTPHTIEGVLMQLPGKWISSACLTHYQALLLDAPRVRFQTPCFLNPATLLPNPEKDRPLHDCSEILAEALAARKDLTDVPLSNSELVWFTDGSSYVKDGQRKAGAAIVDDSGQMI